MEIIGDISMIKESLVMKILCEVGPFYLITMVDWENLLIAFQLGV